MKIGAMANFASLNGLEEELMNAQRMGIGSCQLCSWTPSLWTEENANSVKQLIEKYEIEISAFWCGWEGPAVWDFYEGQLTLGLVPVEYRQMRIEQLCAGGDFAKLLDITDVVTHIGFIPENPNDPNFASLCVAIRTVARHLKGNGQNLLFETGQETPVTMLRCFEKVGEDNLFVNLDTANLILYGSANPVDSLDVFGKYVRNLHAKDGLYPVNGHDLGREVKLGEGKVDFLALFKRLKELGYNSYVTIEREISGEKQLEDIYHAKNYLSEIIDSVYGEGTAC